MREALAVGIDIGATTISVGLVRDPFRIEAQLAELGNDAGFVGAAFRASRGDELG